MSAQAATGARRARVRGRVDGVVQGVGFRPYVYRLAGELGLDGFVQNDARGVLFEVEGEQNAVVIFLARLPAEAPPLARVERVTRQDLAPTGRPGFAIAASPAGEDADALVSADSAMCADCLGELLDPADRRFRYPFINCTNCGPRFTIVRGVPYDRPRTTMAAFEMCVRCRSEYEDPRDRRFHAQPNACPRCGPAVRLVNSAGDSVGPAGTADAVAAAADALHAGSIVAVKGVGGYHLACRANDERAVADLRARKHREDRPFALMVGDVDAAKSLVELCPEERALLVSPQRPIVLAPRRAGGTPIAASVAPRAPELGVMLPYSPLHHLLLADVGTPLVMTSGNVSDEPIAHEDADALARLGSIADCFLLHDRPIHTRTDDSVMRVVEAGGDRRPLMLRRSRGHVPASLTLPIPAERPVLACGAEQKSTFCVARGRRAWVGHHIGDLANYETLRSFQEGVDHFERLFAVETAVVAHDLHPDYLSTKYAHQRAALVHVGVQHHHAHLAACLAEHGETGTAVGAIYDGTGLGTDGTIWGGELLVGDLNGFERAGHLWPVRMPGGERAIREPWRMACAWLTAAEGPDPGLPSLLEDRVDPARWSRVAALCRSGLAAPLTTSAGRLFDAIAALCGIRTEVSYEGQAAIELEAAATAAGDEAGTYPLPAPEHVMDARETVRALQADLAAGIAVPVVAARFHNTVAAATAAAGAALAGDHGTETVVLSGGVFQNRLLLDRTAAALTRRGLRVLVPELLPPNDGGIAFGQAAVAASQTAASRPPA